jgi:hypothetical protein
VALTCADRVLFMPHQAHYVDGPDILKLRTADGKTISAMYLPNANARYTILFSHGNGEDMGDDRSDLLALQHLGFSVLAYDYHGYGTSEGRPTEANCYLDIEAAYDYLTGTLKVPPEGILIYGRSVGGGPGIDLAARRPCAGLILESAFTTAFRTHWLGYLVPGDRFRNIDKIGRVRCPVLVMHGRRDWIVPFAHGQQLFAAANEPKRCLWVDRAGHNDVALTADQAFDQALLDFGKLVERGDR